MAARADLESHTAKQPEGLVNELVGSSNSSTTEEAKPNPPMYWKLIAVILISCISFGSSWSSGITGALKSTLKKELHINNKQFSLLEASEDFMVTLLILFSGMVTDRIGGAGAMLYGNIIYSIGSIIVAAAAQVRSFKLMIAGRVILALGDIATQVAQYKVFSSWFSPNNGFASTLGLELGIKKIGGFVGKSSANIIAKNTGNFAWVFWISVFMNVFTNVLTLVFYRFNGIAHKKFGNMKDPATGEKLTEKSKKFQPKQVLELPWAFWAIMAFSLFQTSTAVVFSQNATELAEKRFNTDSITAGWYSAILQYAGFFLVPCLGAFIDILGNRITLLAICGTGVFLAMSLINWVTDTKGAAAAFGIYAVAFTLGPTTIIDSIRTSMWHASTFGTAYAVKMAMNNSMNIIVRVVTGVIQDADNDSYDHVVIVYAILSGASVLVSIILIALSWWSIDLGNLQWTRKQRIAHGELWNERKRVFYEDNGPRNKIISKACFGALIMLIFGAWAAYFWGIASGHNS
ncbi:major facilitator superfamily transporter [Colletotrichum graminicola]|uniref:Lysosomal dipeptide transporter MFSD1 n=1 Tax=Colletotrichum graminicola (strain M1.001 / M2 / FGSC 10212) TaxID=645133 RepID=E3Q5M5_COLGM|nr:major facilitator superfamily transporter [Colletotrichum graminicola M1.001]EFQ25992.1 major facilitator superfamily transporter [Colletotrichum graminicola M1.001]WDK23116.1 major facilitator superfamily transporter [Colletotrichum graminicola]